MLKYQEVKNLVDDEKNLPLLNKIAARFGISDFKEYVNRLGAFTLAEMLVVMLIGTIFTASSIQVITKRTKNLPNANNDEIWKYTENNSDIYFQEKVNIGSNQVNDGSLYISSDGTKDNPQIEFWVTGSTRNAGFLRFGTGKRLVLGSGVATADEDGGIAIGPNSRTYTANSIAIGNGAFVSDSGLEYARTQAVNSIDFHVKSYKTYYTLVSKHNFITGVAYEPYSFDCSYTIYHHEVTQPKCGYVYGQGFVCSGSVVVFYAYTEYVPATCWDFYSRWSFTWGERFSPVRGAGASDVFYVKVTCPDVVTVFSKVDGKVIASRDIHPQPALSGHFSVFTKVDVNGYQYGLEIETSTALYSFDLAHGHIDPAGHITTGHCHDDISKYNSGSYYSKNIIAYAKGLVKNDALASLAATPSIAIGDQARATNMNTIAIGYLAHADSPNQIVLGNSGSVLRVGGMTISSDSSLKNIKGLYNRGIKELRKLKTYLFSFKSDEDNNVRAGLIAQDVQKVMPEAVSEIDKKGHLGIKNEYITYAMFNAILELDKSLESISKRQFVLERKIAKQEIRIQKLKKTVNELKKKK